MRESRIKPIVLSAFLVLFLLLPKFLESYWIYVLTITLYYIVLATSWNLLAGITGQFSLAHHAFALIGAYISSLVVIHSGIPIWMGVVIALLATLLISMLLGILCLRMRGIYLALATWAFAEVVRAYLRMNYKFTGGDRGLETPTFFDTLQPIPYYYLFLGLALLTITIIAVLMHTRIGYYLRAIRNDQIAAQALGVDIVRWKVFAFVLASGIAGLAGAFYAHSVSLVSPVLGEFTEIAMIIILVVIGGMRSQAGPVIGAITVRYLSEVFREWPELRMLLLAVMVMLIIRFFNGGIMQFLKIMYKKITEKSKLFQPDITKNSSSISEHRDD
jgi:branched-chain amino acid transport system permease protein